VLSLMLPKTVVAGLKSGSRHSADQFKEASVLFIEISDFAALSATLPASELVALLNFVFTTFDDVLEAGSLHSFPFRLNPSLLVLYRLSYPT